ncbi:FecCD family ABC transporter permease [Nocardioides sp.]|uniref:FecCD family ABC transporter permease n=1 Tax=Nocardioides sp. TaxID=35761 RepID=UPI002B266B5A|nr:iron chelate uptake ABC transporter family permease subunit [Nocardioides sp.]
MSVLTAERVAAQALVDGRARRRRARRRAVLALAVLVVVLFVVSLMVGRTFYPLGDVVRVVLGQDVPGASFTVGELRLPRAVLAVLTGAAFGLGGVTFQTMLRNPLASPDIIGVTSGASVAAVIGIVVLSLDETLVSIAAMAAALSTALVIYLLAFTDGVVGTRLILVGIGVAAMLDSVVAYVIVRAAPWDLQDALRWLTGSLNGATWDQVVPLAVGLALLTPLLLGQARNLALLQQGDDSATALGVRVERTRLVTLVTAVALVSFATAAAGPIAFVAFLSGPIAARVVRGGDSLMLPAALVGALLVCGADLLAQHALGARYPVGVVTGALGAPFLLHLLIRSHQTGGSL